MSGMVVGQGGEVAAAGSCGLVAGEEIKMNAMSKSKQI
jgi:hypothetical protein